MSIALANRGQEEMHLQEFALSLGLPLPLWSRMAQAEFSSGIVVRLTFCRIMDQILGNLFPLKNKVV